MPNQIKNCVSGKSIIKLDDFRKKKTIKKKNLKGYFWNNRMNCFPEFHLYGNTLFIVYRFFLF